MEKLIFTNSRGESIELANQAPFVLKQVKGLDGLQVNVQTKKSPFQLGKSYLDTKVDERLISLNIVLLNSNENEKFKLRENILRVFNPILGEGTLKYVYGEKEKEIKAAVNYAPQFNIDDVEATDEQLQTIVHLFAADPLIKDIFETSKEMSYLLGGIHFKLRLPTKFSTRSYKRIFENKGDAQSPVKIEFYGPAIKPSVRNNTTGEYITVKRDLAVDEVLIIDTSFDDKKVLIKDSEGNIKNAFGWIDLNSTFWQLQIGKNEVEYVSNNDSKKTKVIVKYKNRYIGV